MGYCCAQVTLLVTFFPSFLLLPCTSITSLLFHSLTSLSSLLLLPSSSPLFLSPLFLPSLSLSSPSLSLLPHSIPLLLFSPIVLSFPSISLPRLHGGACCHSLLIDYSSLFKVPPSPLSKVFQSAHTSIFTRSADPVHLACLPHPFFAVSGRPAAVGSTGGWVCQTEGPASLLAVLPGVHSSKGSELAVCLVLINSCFVYAAQANSSS